MLCWGRLACLLPLEILSPSFLFNSFSPPCSSELDDRATVAARKRLVILHVHSSSQDTRDTSRKRVCTFVFERREQQVDEHVRRPKNRGKS